MKNLVLNILNYLLIGDQTALQINRGTSYLQFNLANAYCPIDGFEKLDETAQMLSAATLPLSKKSQFENSNTHLMISKITLRKP